MGGPMMGLAQASTEVPVIKGTSGIVLLTENDVRMVLAFAAASAAEDLPIPNTPVIR